MKYTDLEGKDAKALNELLKEKKLLLFKLRAKLRTMQLSNPNEIKEVKKDIARISTAISALKNEVKA
jgi:large subunit ribosomal protein L29